MVLTMNAKNVCKSIAYLKSKQEALQKEMSEGQRLQAEGEGLFDTSISGDWVVA